MCVESQRQEKNPVVVTACREENLAQIQTILEASPEAAPWSAPGLRSIFAGYPSYLLVGWQCEEIAGFIASRRVHDEAEILNLAVKPRFRRQGVANTLVKALLEVFAGESVLKVFLEVRQSNTAAISFYLRLGFREIGKREGYYREPDEAALVLGLCLRDIRQPGTG